MSCLIGTAGHLESEKPTLAEAIATFRSGQSGNDFTFRELPADIGTSPFDAVILRVDATKGLTRDISRQIAILNLLPFDSLIVAITSPERVDNDSCVMVMDDVVHALDGTRFERAPIIPVSPATGEGLAALSAALDQIKPQATKLPSNANTFGEFEVGWLDKPTGSSEFEIEIDGRQILGKVSFTDEESVIQVRFPEPVPLAPGSPVLIRRLGPSTVIGGGFVRTQSSETQSKGDGIRRVQLTNIEEGIIAAIHEDPNGVPTQEICRLMGVSQQQLGDYFERLIKERRIIGFAGIWYQPHVFLAQANVFLKALRELHDEHPLVLNQPREAVLQRTKHNWSGKPLDRILTKLAELGKIQIDGTKVKLTDFKIALNPRQEAFLQRVEEELNKIVINVPYPSEIASRLGAPVQAVEEILNTAANAGRIVKIGETLYYTNFQIERLKDEIRKVSKGEPFSAVEMKEALETSRKYISPVLDYFDAIGFTVRVDGQRVVQN